MQVDFELAGVAMQAQVILTRGGSYGDRWVILNPLRPLLVTGPVGGGLLIFGRYTVPAVRPRVCGVSGRLPGHPGQAPLFEADPVTALALGAPTVEVVARVRADARREINRQIRTRLNACIESRDVNPAPCPLTILWTPPFQPSAADASRTITRYPTVLMEPSPAVGYPLVFRNDSPGEIQVSVRTSPTGVPVSPKETFTVSGRVVLEGGAIVGKPES